MLKWEITPTTPTPSWKKCKRLVTSPRMPSQEPCCARSYHQAVLLWPCTLLSSMESFCPLCWVSSALQSLTTFQEEDQLFSFDLSHPTGVGPALVSSRVWCPFHQVSVPQLNWPQLMFHRPAALLILWAFAHAFLSAWNAVCCHLLPSCVSHSVPSQPPATCTPDIWFLTFSACV